MENMRENNANNNLLSIKGLLFSLLTTLIILIIQEVISIFTGSRYLDTYFVIGWILIPSISASVYAKFGTGRENFSCILLIAIINFLLPYFFYYFADIFFVSIEYQVGYLDILLEIPIYSYLIMCFYDDFITIGAIELSNLKLLIFNLIGFIFYLCYTKKRISKINCYKGEQAIEDIAAKMQSDMLNNK